MNILVAEDAAVNAILLRNILEHAGHRVIPAENGVEALELLERTPEIDLLAVDILMPEMGGLELVRAVRDRPAWASLPVIFITGVSDAATVKAALELHSLGYILKPVVEPSRVLRLVEAAGSQAGVVLEEADDIRSRLGIDQATYQRLLEVMAQEVVAARTLLESDGGTDWTRLRDSADQLGATRLARAIVAGGGNRVEHPVLVRELDALDAELAARGVSLPAPA